MGHREDLLAGAKQCLLEKGYGRTTSRDIVQASGANLASIGYHYGSKEALLNAALLDALAEAGDEVHHATKICATLASSGPFERFEAAWEHVVEAYASRHQMLLASVEVFAQVDRVPEIRAAVSEGFQQGRDAMVELFKAIIGSTDDLDEETGIAVGSFLQALATGVMSQWLVDPDRAPSGSVLAKALRTMTASMMPTQSQTDSASEE
jgi:AcrR family transcriptional regulator